MRRLWYVMWKELLELRQDPRLFSIIFLAPVIQLTLLGYAATTDVKDVPLLIVDQDRSPASRQLISRFEASPYFSIAGTVGNVNDVEPWLERGKAWLALTIPADYHEAIDGGRPATLQIIADGTDSSSTGIAMGYAASLVNTYNQELARQRLLAAGQDAPPTAIDARIRVWFNPELESRYFMIPGIVALLLLVITTNLSSMAVVREKELGTLEQLNVTPITRWQLIVGKLLPYAVIGIIDVVLVIAVALLWFRIPLLGSPVLLFVTSGIYLLTTLGLGLFISTISDTQQQAMMTGTFFFLTPMLYLSGFIFPIENMPAVIQPFTYLIPLRYFIVIVRGIFLKGIGWSVLWPQIAALLHVGAGDRGPGGRPVAKDAQLTVAARGGSSLKKATRPSPSFSSAITRTLGSRIRRATASSYEGRECCTSCTTRTVAPRRWSSAIVAVSGNPRMWFSSVKYDAGIEAAVPVQQRTPVQCRAVHVAHVDHVPESPGHRDGPFEEHRVGRCLEPGVDHGRIRLDRHQHRTCETFDRRQADGARGERGPDGGTGQRRHQPGQPVAGEDGGPEQDEDVGPRGNPETTERQHPVVQQAIEAAVESERQVDRERQADGVDDPHAVERRPEPDNQQNDPDEARKEMALVRGERFRPSIEQAAGRVRRRSRWALHCRFDSSSAGRSPTSLRLRM